MTGASKLPAVLGGAPVRPDGRPPWPRPMPEVEAAIQAALATGEWGLYRGEHVPLLESELATFHDVPHALTCSSGTLAVEIALRALGVRPGDEVLMAAYDYESNFLSVHALGAKPVLVDVSPRNGNLDPNQLAAAISGSTKAVICSHLHGGLVPMREVMEFARSRNIGVVEDAAQATGATVQGKPTGTWGDIGTMSFGGSKLMTAGRGGALLVRDPQVFQRAKVALHRGVQAWAALSELQAIALRPQLKMLPAMTQLRTERVNWLKTEIASSVRRLHPFENDSTVGRVERRLCDASPAVTVAGERRGSHSLDPPYKSDSEAGEPAYYKFGFIYDAAAFGLPRMEFVKAMRAEGIAFDAGFNALNVGRSPTRFRAAGELPHATALHDCCVVLHHPVLSGSEEEVSQVIEALRKVQRHFSAS